MSNLLKNWKTTSMGLSLIIGAVVSFFFVPISPAMIGTQSTAILSGIGLLIAADSTTNPPAAS